jgi:hypothetical protein
MELIIHHSETSADIQTQLFASWRQHQDRPTAPTTWNQLFITQRHCQTLRINYSAHGDNTRTERQRRPHETNYSSLTDTVRHSESSMGLMETRPGQKDSADHKESIIHHSGTPPDTQNQVFGSWRQRQDRKTASSTWNQLFNSLRISARHSESPIRLMWTRP